MIQSAQVFTPKPSQNPKENLRILKTPIKTPFSSSKTPGMSARRRRESSPLKRGAYIPTLPEESDEEDDKEEEIVLVETNHPKVVEEDRDLVILEHVTVDVPEPEPEPEPRVVQFPLPQSAQPQVPQTPRRRPRASLHRAVLIRSAQRTAMKAEMEMEEERDAEEVEETIQALEGLKEEAEDEDEEDEEEHAGEDGEGDEMDVREEQQPQQTEEEKEQETPVQSTPLRGWRKSLGSIAEWALRSPTKRAAEKTEEKHVEV